MNEYNDLIKFFKNLQEEQIVDILIAVIVIAAVFIFSGILSYVILKLFMWKEKDSKKIKSNPFYLPLKILFIFIGIYVGLAIIELPISVMKIWRRIFKIVLICIVAKGLVNFVDPKSEIAKKIRNKRGMSKETHTTAHFTGRLLKYIIYAIAALFILSELNYNVSALLTGLGIGGAVVALAAQDIVKSLLSGFSIMADKPFLVGDYIQVGTDEGTVKEISFRSTKIMTMDNILITIPNSSITAVPVMNWSKMKQRRYYLDLKLPLETNSDTMETIVNRIEFVLKANENIVADTVQVHFNSIEQNGSNIMIYVYTKIVDYTEYLAFRQEVNELILKVLESEGVTLAYPGQNIYLKEVEPTVKIEQIEAKKSKKVVVDKKQ